MIFNLEANISKGLEGVASLTSLKVKIFIKNIIITITTIAAAAAAATTTTTTITTTTTTTTTITTTIIIIIIIIYLTNTVARSNTNKTVYILPVSCYSILPHTHF